MFLRHSKRHSTMTKVVLCTYVCLMLMTVSARPSSTVLPSVTTRTVSAVHVSENQTVHVAMNSTASAPQPATAKGIVMLDDATPNDQVMFNSTVANKLVLFRHENRSLVCQVYTRHVPIAIIYKINTSRIISQLHRQWDSWTPKLEHDRPSPCYQYSAADVIYLITAFTVAMLVLLIVITLLAATIKASASQS